MTNQSSLSGLRYTAQSSRTRWWIYRSGIAVAALILLFCFALVIWKVPIYQVKMWESRPSVQDTISIKELADLEDKFRKTLVQLLGGAIAGITALLTALKALKKRFDISQDTVFMERFVRAVDQLGATDENGMKKLEIRLGGIYALERVAWDSPSDHWPIMEILTAYLREHAVGKGIKKRSEGVQTSSPGLIQPQSDIQAILAVIRRRRHLEKESREQVLNFSETDLTMANLAGAHLDGADFSNTILREAKFIEAQLKRVSLANVDAEGANFGESNLEGADITGANLSGARFRSASLQGANLTNAKLNGVNFINANLGRATLMKAQLKEAKLMNTDLQVAYLYEANMAEADLKNANLEKAYLMGSNLEGANFSQANLKEANLAKAKMRKVRNLSEEQISVVETLFQAELEPELLNTITKIYPHLLRKPE